LPAPAPRRPSTNLPEPVSELIGRDDELREILSLAGAHRLVTPTGPGGIGNTRLASAAARQLLPHFADGVWLAEFSPLTDPGLVPATVAAAVGLELGAGEVSAQRVAQALADRRLLLVLDNCEHMIAAATAMAEAITASDSATRSTRPATTSADASSGHATTAPAPSRLKASWRRCASRARHQGARRPPRQSFPAADRRPSHGITAAPDVAGDARLEL
jgi:predicted ATPase